MKQYLIFGLVFMFMMTGASAVLNESVFLYYKLDGDTTSANGFYDGTAVGATYNAGYGIINGGYDFDGVNDYISIGSNLLADETSPFSINMWAYNHDFDAYKSIINLENMAYINLGKVSTTYYIRFYVYDGGDSIVDYTNTVNNTGYIIENQWNMYTLVFNGTKIKGYINGNYIGQDDATRIDWSYASRTWRIGSAYGGSPYYNGWLDEIGIWAGKALSQDEIDFLYAGGSPTTDQQYPFSTYGMGDDCDYSGSGNWIIDVSCTIDTNYNLQDGYSLIVNNGAVVTTASGVVIT